MDLKNTEVIMLLDECQENYGRCFDSLYTLNEFLDQKSFNIKGLHHVGLIMPQICGENYIREVCEKFCYHKAFDALIGYYFLNDLCVELIYPRTAKSILFSSQNKFEYRFDHFCLRHEDFSDRGIPIMLNIETCLFENNVNFFLLDKKYKIETINCKI